jgi:Protein kinase domain/PASTA domain
MGGKGPLPRNGHPARSVGEDGRYRLLQLINEDGLGALWEGEDSFLQCPVAVRLLSKSVVPNRRVIRELRKRLDDLHRRLDHPTIAYVYGYGDSEGPEQFVVMEPLSGETLAQRIRRSGALEPAKALRLAAEIADGLQAAHSIGHTHGGLTGESVVLQRDGSVKIIDFGVAPVTGSNAQEKDDSPPASEPTSPVGGPAADVHQLTVLLREMLGSDDRPNATLDLNGAARRSAIELASTLRRAAAEAANSRAEETRKAREVARQAEEVARETEVRRAEITRNAQDAAWRAQEARGAEEAARAEHARKADEATRAEEARKASVARREEALEGVEEAARRAQEARRAEEAARGEHARRAEEATRAEEARKASVARGEETLEGVEEAARRAQEARRAEEAARGEHARRAEEATRAEEGAREAEILRADIERKAGEAAERVRTAHLTAGDIEPIASPPVEQAANTTDNVDSRAHTGGDGGAIEALADPPRSHAGSHGGHGQAVPEAPARVAVVAAPADVSQERLTPLASNGTSDHGSVWTPITPWRSPRMWLLGGAGAVALIVAGILVTTIPETTIPGERTPPTAPVDQQPPAAVTVPDLRGLSAAEARDLLMDSGLILDRIVPVAGTPGIVVDTQPTPGEAVPPGTPVMLSIGVEPDRLDQPSTS